MQIELLELEGAQPGLRELSSCLRELLGGQERSWRLVDQERLKRRVHRLRFHVDGEDRSFVVKRSSSRLAQCNHMVATRWLPAIGLEDHGPALLALAAPHDASAVWQVYEDLGRHTLERKQPVRDHIEATVRVLALVHTGFAAHPLRSECRLLGGDLGMSFFASSVRNATAALRALEVDGHAPERLVAIHGLLLERLLRLREQEPERVLAIGALGAPETILHGDPWTVNVLLAPTAEGFRVQLIDWDHVGVGPISYDLSTFLLRFPRRHRRWILDAYRREAERLAGWRLPPDTELNRLFETAEYARFSSVVSGAARAVHSVHRDWALDRLEAINEWFEAYEPVLPT
jgi:hypothetical protein